MKASTVNRLTPIDALPEYLRPEEAAAVLGISKGLVYELARRGDLPSRKFGRLLRIPRHAVAAGVQP